MKIQVFLGFPVALWTCGTVKLKVPLPYVIAQEGSILLDSCWIPGQRWIGLGFT